MSSFALLLLLGSRLDLCPSVVGLEIGIIYRSATSRVRHL